MSSSWVVRRSSGRHDVAAARGALRADGEMRVAAYGACKKGRGSRWIPGGTRRAPSSFLEGPMAPWGPFAFSGHLGRSGIPLPT